MNEYNCKKTIVATKIVLYNILLAPLPKILYFCKVDEKENIVITTLLNTA